MYQIPVDVMIDHYKQLSKMEYEASEAIMKTGIDWRHLAARDEKLLAIKKHYRDSNRKSLKESKDAVEEFIKLLNT